MRLQRSAINSLNLQKQEPRAHMALVTRSEPKIRLSTRIINFIVVEHQEAPNLPKH